MGNSLSRLVNRFLFLRNSSLLRKGEALPTLYHGGPKRFESFDVARSNFRGLTYFTASKQLAKAFAGGRGHKTGFVYSVKVPSNLHLFDATDVKDLDHLKVILTELVNKKSKDPITEMDYNPEGKTIYLEGQAIKNPTTEQFVDHTLWRLKNKSWRILEGEEITKYLQSQGYDGLITSESGAKNVGLFPKAINKVEIVEVEEIGVDPN
jgi:hypothetical protein